MATSTVTLERDPTDADWPPQETFRVKTTGECCHGAELSFVSYISNELISDGPEKFVSWLEADLLDHCQREH